MAVRLKDARRRLAPPSPHPPRSLDALRWATKSLVGREDELHLVSVLESGLAHEVVGESAAEGSPDCKPDPAALLRTQDLLQQCKGEAVGAGERGVGGRSRAASRRHWLAG